MNSKKCSSTQLKSKLNLKPINCHKKDLPHKYRKASTPALLCVSSNSLLVNCRVAFSIAKNLYYFTRATLIVQKINKSLI